MRNHILIIIVENYLGLANKKEDVKDKELVKK